MSNPPKVGTIGWTDLTVDDAPALRSFYSEVVGWSSTEADMGGYSDYCMNAPGGDTVAGICHARGSNEGLPAKWLVYINVEDADVSAARVESLGGRILKPVTNMAGQGRYCVIEDPAGAVCALFEPAEG